jgi:hypothetical protein
VEIPRRSAAAEVLSSPLTTSRFSYIRELVTPVRSVQAGSMTSLTPAQRAELEAHAKAIERRFENFDFDTATVYEAGDPNTPPHVLLTKALAARALAARALAARADQPTEDPDASPA